MKFIYSFDEFLKNAVNLNQTRVEQADEAFETLTSFVRNADKTSTIVIDASRQGSLRQGTIIKPRTDETEFDVDMLVNVRQIKGWEPKSYLQVFRDAFADSDRYRKLVDIRGKHRCITIEYATNDFHVDMVPSIEQNGQCFIMNRETNQFEMTDGDGYARWFAGRNEITGGANLVRVVRLCKYLRDEHEWPVKSILLTTLLAEQVIDDDAKGPYPYADVPTSLRTIVSRLDDWLQAHEELPEVVNPALPSESFTRHWDQETYDAFREKLHTAAEAVASAFDELDQETSAEQWQDLFGEAFAIQDEDLTGGETLPEAVFLLGATGHAKPPSAIPVSGVDIQYKARIDAWVYNQKGTKRFRGINSNARMLSGLALRFRVRTNAPEPYQVTWQVVNTGSHATSEEDLRGEFYTGRTLKGTAAAKHEHWETTKYTGRHWIECFIVRDSVCVARSNPFYVNIKNPQY